MASYSVAASKHAVLVAATVDTVSFTTDWAAVLVENRGASGDIYFTVNGATPTSGGDDTYVLTPGEFILVTSNYSGDAVKLISAGTPSYSVTGVDGATKKDSTGSGAVTVSSLPTQTAGTGTKSNVAGSASSVTILASNTSRKRWSVYNDSTAILYLDTTGGTASSTSYTVQVPANGYFEGPPPVNTGLITGIWASATGNARVTEWA